MCYQHTIFCLYDVQAAFFVHNQDSCVSATIAFLWVYEIQPVLGHILKSIGTACHTKELYSWRKPNSFVVGCSACSSTPWNEQDLSLNTANCDSHQVATACSSLFALEKVVRLQLGYCAVKLLLTLSKNAYTLWVDNRYFSPLLFHHFESWLECTGHSSSAPQEFKKVKLQKLNIGLLFSKALWSSLGRTKSRSLRF